MVNKEIGDQPQKYFDGDVKIDGVTINFNEALEEDQIHISGFEDILTKKYKQFKSILKFTLNFFV